jgi:hypothetical protein
MGANPLDQAALDAAMKAHTEALDVADLPGESRLNTKIDNVQTQLLEKKGSFVGSSSSSDGKDGAPLPLIHKLCFPKYDSIDDPLGWPHKCEQFFHSQGTPASQQVWTTAFYLEGASDQWYFRLEKNHRELSWEFIDDINKHTCTLRQRQREAADFHLLCRASASNGDRC